jgi:hypothetical protein
MPEGISAHLPALRGSSAGTGRGGPSRPFASDKEDIFVFALNRPRPCDLSSRLRSEDIMAKHLNDSAQKVEVGGRGVSGFSESDVERRARELARIDDRTEVTEEDREAALAEFRDRHLPDAVNEDAESMQSLSRDPSDPMVDRGRQVPNHGGDDEKAALEHLALEGVEEAQHEQMLEARNDVDEPLRSRPGRRES